MTRRIEALAQLGQGLANCLPGPRGALCFQAMRDSLGVMKLFEINPRFGGGFPLADQAGGRFALWLLEEVAHRQSSASDNWQDGVMMLRYDTALFTRL